MNYTESIPMPVWGAALIASQCQASAGGYYHEIPWKCTGDRLIYTNTGSATEFIQALGVRLKSGHTVAVSWEPKDTAYTIEVYRQFDYRA